MIDVYRQKIAEKEEKIKFLENESVDQNGTLPEE